MARYVEAHGGQVVTSSPVTEILVDDNHARGVRLADGRRSPRDGRWSLRWSRDRPSSSLSGERKLAPDFIDMVRRFSFGQISVCRLQLALSEPPRFTTART